MGESMEFVKDRATKTLSAARQVAGQWTWQEKPLADMKADLAALVGDKDATPPLPGQEEIASDAERAMLAARGKWDEQLHLLHRYTMQGVGMAKMRHRDHPAALAALAVLAPLSAKGDSRSATLAEALEWESAWAQIDPAWSPLPANSFAAFQALRKACTEDLKTAYSDALNDMSVAWYADATRVFPAGTPEGDMIRGTIPTTYDPSSPPPPPATP